MRCARRAVLGLGRGDRVPRVPPPAARPPAACGLPASPRTPTNNKQASLSSPSFVNLVRPPPPTLDTVPTKSLRMTYMPNSPVKEL